MNQNTPGAALSDADILAIRKQHPAAIVLDGEALNFASDILAAADRRLTAEQRGNLLVWADPPTYTAWGACMKEALLELDKDHTLRLFAEEDALELVAPALRAALTTQPQAEPAGYALGMRVLQSDLRPQLDPQLDPLERDACDALIAKRVAQPQAEPPTFEEAWAVKVKAGYQYGHDALEQVRFGWEIRDGYARGVHWPLRGVRVEGDTVVVSVNGGNEAARWLCGELVKLIPQKGASGE